MLARQPGARREYKVALDAHRDSVESWRTAEKVFRKAEARFEEASKRAETFGMARVAVEADHGACGRPTGSSDLVA